MTVGAFEPRALLLVSAEIPLSEAMSSNSSLVSSVTCQQEAALANASAKFKSLPIVDQDGRLVAQITTKRPARVIAEDVLKLGGVMGVARSTDSVPRIMRNRLP